MSTTRRAGAGAIAVVAATVIAAAMALGAAAGPAVASPFSATRAPDTAPPSGHGWAWPFTAFRIAAPYRAPAHAYGPGHRGIDLAPAGSHAVRAPADGVVAFSGSIAGRGILTIDHGDGLVTTLEPIDSSLEGGAPVRRGETVGTLSVGGHAAPGTLHFGVRRDGEYVNPLLLVGSVPRAVLLPCCS